MERFNADVRGYALANGKPLLDVAAILSHDYAGVPCYDTRDGVGYCQGPDRCENLSDDGVDIPAICQHYTSELYGGHLGSVSSGALRMAQAMWVMMARLASGETPASTPTTTTTSSPPGPTVTPEATPQPGPTATPTVTPASGPAVESRYLPALRSEPG